MLALLFASNAFGYQTYENFKYIYICIFPDVFKYMNCEVLRIYKKKKKEKKT